MAKIHVYVAVALVEHISSMKTVQINVYISKLATGETVQDMCIHLRYTSIR